MAGKRKGLAGERSGLFMEQIRCVKELRRADELRGRTGIAIRPRYMVWENVPGAFSSGNPKGADFAAVIEEIIKVAEPGAVVYVCVPDRGWNKSGCYYAEDGSWSIAWRVHDAQFWGVPQRRKRISLVADFGGISAPEILFVRKGLSRDSESSGTQREEAAGAAVQSAGEPEPILLESNQNHATIQVDGISTALPASMGMGGGYVLMVAGFGSGQGEKAGGIGWQEECSPSLKAANSGTNQVPAVLPFDTTQITSPKNKSSPTYGDPCHPIAASAHAPAVAMTMQAFGNYKQSEVASACKQRDYKDATDLVVSVDCRNGYENTELSGTIQAKENGGQSLNYINPVRCVNTVRRLTPLECERLQGYPDGWTDIGEWVDSKGKRHKEADSPRYKALGNSIALPFWQWLMKRISAQYERDATLGSLFDGIGGFPLCWEQINGEGSARWASEIEEFPMAVTKLRFGEE